MNDQVSINDIVQGGLVTCYFLSAGAAVAEFPELIKFLFLNQNKNWQDINAIRIFVRGKPWVVTIDNRLLFSMNKETE